MRMVAVSKCLDKKLILFGYEVFDIIAIFLVLSILNFVFGGTEVKLILVWLPTILLAAILRFGKRGKPDKFLIHWIRFQFREGTFSAFDDPTNDTLAPTMKKRGTS